MESGAFGLNWAQMGGALAGCALVFAVLFGLVWLKRRRREERRERPPQQDKLLRPAGHSAMCRIEQIEEELTHTAFRAVGAGFILGIMVVVFWPLITGLALGRFSAGQVWAVPKSGLIVAAALAGLAAFLWAIRELVVVSRLMDELRHWRFGLRGEQAVAEKLADREVAAAGYVAFHDVPGDGNWNIDHVVVGPGGVFVLETKTRPRRKATRKQAEHEVVFDGRTLEFPWCSDAEAAAQVERNTAWVRRFLNGFGPEDLLFQPVIVVPGWYAKATGNYAVKVMNAKYLVDYLKAVTRIFTSEQLKLVIRRLDERCRVVEF